jgi:hypothetical protein
MATRVKQTHLNVTFLSFTFLVPKPFISHHNFSYSDELLRLKFHSLQVSKASRWRSVFYTSLKMLCELEYNIVSARTFDSTRICDVCTESSRYPLDTSVNNCGALVWKDWGKLRIVLGTSEKKIWPTFIKCKHMERDGWGTKWNNEKLSLDMKSVTFEILSHFQTQRSGLCREKKQKQKTKY